MDNDFFNFEMHGTNIAFDITFSCLNKPFSSRDSSPVNVKIGCKVTMNRPNLFGKALYQ